MSQPLPLVLWGASGHARVVADIVRLQGLYHIVALLDDMEPTRHGSHHAGAPIVGGREQLAPLRAAGVASLIVAIGACATRQRLAAHALAAGFTLATAIHPRATVAAETSLGAGTVVMAGAILNPNCHVGQNVIVNTAATLDHDTLVADGAHIGPGAHLGGNVRIGAGSWIGIGAILRDNVAVGDNSIVGAGAVVVKDIPSGVVAYGVPATIIRENR